MDYNKPMIEVTSQAELDAVPVDYHGRIIIKFGTPYNGAIVNKKFEFASVVASDSASVRASGSASVEAYDSASVEAYDSASVEAYGSASVRAYGSASVVASGSASVVASGSASVEAYDSASVEAYGSASVRAYGSASVDLDGFAQACVYSAKKAEAKGNARLIYPTRTITDFMAYHAIESTGENSKWYKAVHKRDDGAYTADYDTSFIYEIGKTYDEKVDADTNSDCGFGINMATLSWALDYGKAWSDLAILEVEATSKDVVVPKKSTGKVRTGKVKVLREVPLDECGLLGKHIARRMCGG